MKWHKCSYHSGWQEKEKEREILRFQLYSGIQVCMCFQITVARAVTPFNFAHCQLKCCSSLHSPCSCQQPETDRQRKSNFQVANCHLQWQETLVPGFHGRTAVLHLSAVPHHAAFRSGGKNPLKHQTQPTCTSTDSQEPQSQYRPL